MSRILRRARSRPLLLVVIKYRYLQVGCVVKRIVMLVDIDHAPINDPMMGYLSTPMQIKPSPRYSGELPACYTFVISLGSHAMYKVLSK